MKRCLLILCLFLLALPVMAQTDDDDDDGPRDYPPQYATEEIFALVVYPRVNMRIAPSINSLVVDIAILGDKFPIVGEDETGDWYLVRAPGGVVWIHAPSTIAANEERIAELSRNRSLTPEQQASVAAQVRFAQSTIAVRGALNMRLGPSRDYAIVGRVPADGRVFIIGRDTYGIWMYVSYNGAVGWVSSAYLIFPQGYLLDSVPIVR